MHDSRYQSRGCQENSIQTADRECKRCSPCQSGEYISRDCGVDLDQVSTADRECKRCAPCEPGKYVARPCDSNLTLDRQCDACEAGISFSDEANQAECTPCTKCKAGEKQVEPCTVSSDRQCAKCVGGDELDSSYQNAGLGHTSSDCKQCTTCGRGKFQTAPCTATSDRRCSDCPIRTFRSDDFTVEESCLSCKVCQPGFRVKSMCDEAGGGVPNQMALAKNVIPENTCLIVLPHSGVFPNV